MSVANGDERINIRPEVSILSVLRHLNYKPWYALAEFVDNSLQSFLSNRAAIEALHGNGFRLRVDIELDATSPGRIVVRDNAAGIAEQDYARAFKPAEAPADKSGLSEFGMGMKSAACWLALHWSVRTKAIHEPVERTIAFDVSDIVQHQIEELDIRTRRASANEHYTELILEGLHKSPQGRTIAKIKEHLASIYRGFQGSVEGGIAVEQLKDDNGAYGRSLLVVQSDVPGTINLIAWGILGLFVGVYLMKLAMAYHDWRRSGN